MLDHEVFDAVTAIMWLMLAATGVVLRTRRLLRLRRIALVAPVDPEDARYLALVKRSTYLRLIVKVVFCIGALLALFDLWFLWPLWRLGIIVALSFMLIETISVDRVRDRLGRLAPEAG